MGFDSQGNQAISVVYMILKRQRGVRCSTNDSDSLVAMCEMVIVDAIIAHSQVFTDNADGKIDATQPWNERIFTNFGKIIRKNRDETP